VKKIIATIVQYLIKLSLMVRYRVTVKGLENLNPHVLNKPGGVLFLPNHPAAFVDPTLIALAVNRRYPIRPLIVEYMYYTPMVHPVMKLMDAVPIPNFTVANNSLKKRKSEQMLQEVIKDLKGGSNFLIYPAGKLKLTNIELVGGSSGVHRIIREVPEANVVLVRITGLWGSSFSRALTGYVPPLMQVLGQGIKIALKNLIFFTPKRHVTIEFLPAPVDFPYQASRMELNKYLENWYNRPDGLSNVKVGETLTLVSYKFWKKEYPVIKKAADTFDSQVNLDKVPLDIKHKVIDQLAEMTSTPAEKIKPEMDLSLDLGMDSLDVSELAMYLGDQFEVSGIPVNEFTTVGKVMAIAAKQITFLGERDEEIKVDMKKWQVPPSKERLFLAEGETIPEVFLNNCAKMGKRPACADGRAGVVPYDQLKLRVILLAEYIRQQPGEYIGIMLPASVAAYAVIIATQLAGKIPVMINWTVGPRHLDTVMKICNPQVILSSWAFLDKLPNVDLTPIEDNLVMLEDVRRDFTLKDKLRALLRSKKGTKSVLSTFNLRNKSKDDTAVVLFTSGTEAMPKGVPLSHANILVNQRDCVERIDIVADDVLLGMLPPFHSFGFTITGLLALMMGLRIPYYPDPTDGKKLARELERWGVTIACGAPTFLRSMLKSSNPQQIKTLRYCISGAERIPPELYQLVGNLGKEGIIQEGYGITECAPVLTARVNDPQADGTVGKPLGNVDLCIIHPETHQKLGLRQSGLILARGPNIFKGYLNPGLASPFIEVDGLSWYSTGDLGFLEENGNLTISGRLKRFVKVGGEMVSLASIEEVLAHEALKKRWTSVEEGPSLAILAKEDEGQRSKIFLFSRFSIDLDTVNKTLRDSGFSNIVKVSQIFSVADIPIMGTGKINYRELESLIK
jgi:acyl carrier protein